MRYARPCLPIVFPLSVSKSWNWTFEIGAKISPQRLPSSPANTLSTSILRCILLIRHPTPKGSETMKVSCLQENLSRALGSVARAVAPRSTLPVLGNVLIATEDGRLRLSATNLELGITCWIGAKIEEPGEMINQVAFAASGDDARPVLTGVLAEIKDGVMTLAAADGFRLSVRSSHLTSPEA